MNKVLINIETTQINKRNGIRKDGQPWEIREQPARILSGDPNFPVLAGQVNLRIEGDKIPYAPGRYEIDFSLSVRLSRYGSLELGELVLVPVQAVNSSDSKPLFGKTGT